MINKIEEIRQNIVAYTIKDSAVELEQMISTVIQQVESANSALYDENFDYRRSELIRDLKHTLNKEVRHFKIAKSKKDKQEQLKWATYYLERDLRLFVVCTNGHRNRTALAD